MKCPNCGAEMESGYLQSDISVGITWVPKLLPFGLAYWKMDAETVSTEKMGMTVIPASICKRCKLLLGDYSQKDKI